MPIQEGRKLISTEEEAKERIKNVVIPSQPSYPEIEKKRVFYVLAFEYFDGSGHKVCGVTDQRLVAEAWDNANDETKVYSMLLNDAPVSHVDGIKEGLWINR